MDNDVFNKNKNLRDYDKEPLILRDYSREMLLHGILNLIFFFISLLFAFVIQHHIKFDEFDEIIRKIYQQQKKRCLQMQNKYY